MLYDLADWLLGPLKDLLGGIVTWLSSTSIQAARGIAPERYLGTFAWLSPAWLELVVLLIKMSVVYLLLYLGKAAWGLYLDIKAGVKWW